MLKAVNIKDLSYANKGDWYIPADRSSPLGNPFLLNKYGAERDAVCDAAYAKAILEGMEPCTAVEVSNRKAASYFKLPCREVWLKEFYSLKGNIGCWCKPKRCHVDELIKLRQQYAVE